MRSPFDENGSYTGTPQDGGKPVQEADYLYARAFRSVRAGGEYRRGALRAAAPLFFLSAIVPQAQS